MARLLLAAEELSIGLGSTLPLGCGFYMKDQFRRAVRFARPFYPESAYVLFMNFLGNLYEVSDVMVS